MEQQAQPYSLAAGAEVFYFQSPKASTDLRARLAAIAAGSDGPLKAIVTAVHNQRLADVALAPVGAEADDTLSLLVVRFVPFLHDGDPVPDSPMGYCQRFVTRVPADDAEQHEIMEGKRPARGETQEQFEARLARLQARKA